MKSCCEANRNSHYASVSTLGSKIYLSNPPYIFIISDLHFGCLLLMNPVAMDIDCPSSQPNQPLQPSTTYRASRSSIYLTRRLLTSRLRLPPELVSQIPDYAAFWTTNRTFGPRELTFYGSSPLPPPHPASRLHAFCHGGRGVREDAGSSSGAGCESREGDRCAVGGPEG